MKLLVTGANGFLGRHVVAEARRRGHAVRVMVRSQADVARNGWDQGKQIEPAVADLRRRKGLVEAVRGVDSVLHLAAAKSGDLYAQFAGTVVATENLLAAMNEANVHRIVQISSFSVYDYMGRSCFSVLDETNPIVKDHSDRDEYAHTKLAQEKLVRQFATEHGWDFTILRPGVIYGRDNLWSARLGVQGKRVWVRMGAWARVPLSYVENCAEAILLAAERNEAIGQTINVLDDEMPTQRRYVKVLSRQMKPRPVVLPVAWTVMWGLAGLATVFNKLILGGRAKVPGFLVPSRLAARCKPLRYSNSLLHKALGWKQRYSLQEALERSQRDVLADDVINRAESPAQRTLRAELPDLISV